jgi:hypothetical protein
VTTASQVVTTRRGLLAGAALVAAGCGPDGSSRLEAPGPALDRQLLAQEGAARAYRGLRGREVRRMAASARAGVAKLRAAGAQAPPAPAGPASLRAALAAEERALTAHLRGLGVGPLSLRPLNTDLVIASARHAAQLREMLGLNPAPVALPGAP